MITQERLCLGSWNLIGTLIMTGRWPLLIFRSLGQRSRSQWPEIVKWFPDDNSGKLMARIMKLHRYIDHDSQMTPIDFQVTRSKVKVTVTKNIFTKWLSLQLRAHMGGMHVLQTALVSFYNFSMLWPRVFKLDIKVGHHQQMTTRHFKVIHWKVKVIVTLNVKVLKLLFNASGLT